MFCAQPRLVIEIINSSSKTSEPKKTLTKFNLFFFTSVLLIFGSGSGINWVSIYTTQNVLNRTTAHERKAVNCPWSPGLMITSLIKIFWRSRQTATLQIDVNTYSWLTRSKTCRQSPASAEENSNSFVQLHFLLRQRQTWQNNGRSAIKYVWLDIEKFLLLIITIIKNFLALYTLETLPTSLDFCFNLRWKSTTILNFFWWFRHRWDGLIIVENDRSFAIRGWSWVLEMWWDILFTTLAARRCFFWAPMLKLPTSISRYFAHFIWIFKNETIDEVINEHIFR